MTSAIDTAMSASATPPLLEMRGICKRFGPVLANDQLDFSARRDEVHALLGENGAGKTTLMNILSGLYRADSGEIHLRGHPVAIASPQQAAAQGIGMVHQHFTLVRPFTVVENMMFALGSAQQLWLDPNAVVHKVKELAGRYGLTVDLHARVQDLSVGAQQRVEIIKALLREAEILILDEPTAVLTPQEAGELFKIMRRLAEQGHTVIFITHKLDEVMAVSDQVTVLRDGRHIAKTATAATSKAELARLMVGRDVLFRLNKPAMAPGQTVLEVKELWAHGRHGRPLLRGLSLAVREGEIVGIAGVDGNGQSELAQVLIGTLPSSAGSIVLDRQNITRTTPRDRLRRGMGLIPEDRHNQGLIGSFTVAENLVLNSHDVPPHARGWLLDRREMAVHASDLIREFDIRATDPTVRAGGLSGGNLQKLILAREVHRDPRLLIAAQPTRGLDVGATEYVRRRLLEQRERGRAVLLISADLEEILALSDRILVMFEGGISGALEAGEVEPGKLGLLMASRQQAMAA